VLGRFHGSVEASEIAAWVQPRIGFDRAAEKLVALANERDGSEIQRQLIRVRRRRTHGMYRGRRQAILMRVVRYALTSFRRAPSCRRAKARQGGTACRARTCDLLSQ